MSGSANWRRQRWAVELGWRTGTNLLQICRRWSAHQLTQERRNPANLPVSGWWARKALEMPIGNSKVQGTTCCPGDHLRKICRRSAACAARKEILPIGMVSVVVSCQWRSWFHPRCKFAHRRWPAGKSANWRISCISDSEIYGIRFRNLRG